MSLQNSLFEEDVEYDVTLFARDKRRKRVLVFPPVNNYRRFLIHQLVQERFADVLHTFSIGQGDARRTVVCYKADVIRDPKLDGAQCQENSTIKPKEIMGVEGSPILSPDRVKAQKQAKVTPTVEIYRPPAARRTRNDQQQNITAQIQLQPTVDSLSTAKSNRQRRPDRAVYVPRPRRSLEAEGSPQATERCRGSGGSARNSSVPSSPGNTKTRENDDDRCCGKLESKKSERRKEDMDSEKDQFEDISENHDKDNSNVPLSYDTSLAIHAETYPTNYVQRVEEEERNKCEEEFVPKESVDITENIVYNTEDSESVVIEPRESSSGCSDNEMCTERIDEIVNNKISTVKEEEDNSGQNETSPSMDREVEKGPRTSKKDKIANNKNTQMSRTNRAPGVLIISDPVKEAPKIINDVITVPPTPPEKKVKKIQRPKSKPAPPPAPPVKINRDECDWDSLFDDNGDCLDPTLIDELTSAVGDVTIEQPKNDYKPYTKHIEASGDEFAHVLEIYDFPSEFKTSDLATVFSSFKQGGFELKWVDDTHCLGVFSSPLIAAEVLACDLPSVKTRPLSEATALSRTKAKRSAEFLQPYRSRPETCAALARRLVTGALGVKLATARQEREREKNILREAKEKRRLANKQREDAWEGIIPEK